VTDTELCEAIATGLRAYATAPLADMEVHCWSQLGYEGESGYVVVAPVEGAEVSQGIGSHTAAGYNLVDDLRVGIRAVIVFAETAANRQSIETVCQQIRYWLRANRQVTAGAQTTQRNTDVSWTYGTLGEDASDDSKRTCEVQVTYRKPVEATP
jgi:hypothetical protein